MKPLRGNFGGNVRFAPRRWYAPATESELLALLDANADGRIRAAGAGHSWSDAAACEDVMVDMRAFDSVVVEPGARTVRVGAGCTIDRLVRELRRQAQAALPAISAITRQTVAGAIATGTHGSGAPSLSDLVESLRVAAFDAGTGRARIFEWSEGEALRAARCGLGCTGIVVELRLHCEPLWNVEERFVARGSLDDVLAGQAAYPLQMFLLVPHAWRWLVYQRRRAPAGVRPSRSARAYAAYQRAWVDFAAHGLLRALTMAGSGGPRRERALRGVVRTVLPRVFLRGWRVTDRYDRLLTLEHEWFRHEEMELAVPERMVHEATSVVRRVTDAAARDGSYTHHYPILYRRILPDRTLLSVTGDAAEPWFALSFFSYHPPRRRAAFRRYADAIARALAAACGARPHWGKHFPLDAAAVEAAWGVERLEAFRRFCGSVDPRGVFRNDFTRRTLGF